MTSKSGGIVTGGFALKGLHHYAYKCEDPVKTRHFYEKVLGGRIEVMLRNSEGPPRRFAT